MNVLVVVLLTLIIAWAYFSGFHLATPPPPVTLVSPTTSQLKPHALPTLNSMSVTKTCCVAQVSWPEAWSTPTQASRAHSYGHPVGRFACSDQSDTKGEAYSLWEANSAHCLFTLHHRHCFTVSGKPCHTCLNFLLPWSWRHCIIFCTATQSQRERGAWPYPQPEEQVVGWEALYLIFPPSQADTLTINLLSNRRNLHCSLHVQWWEGVCLIPDINKKKQQQK